MRNKRFPALIKIIAELMKYKVSLAVTFTTAIGYLVFSGIFSLNFLYAVVGVFLLSGGASTLNEIQERKYDLKMVRTKNRPIPSNRISSLNALFIALALILSGSIFLLLTNNASALYLGLFNIIWYNGVYTYLKRVTPFAVVPGSLTGAIPAFIGWTAAGGYILDPKIILIGFFLFIWQVPHFWFLLLKYGKEYEEAGFPSISALLPQQNLKFITYSWIIATSVTTLMFPLFHVLESGILYTMVFLLNIWLVVTFTQLTFNIKIEINFKRTFSTINVFMLIIMLLLAVEAITLR
jgi:protoheme IX farnesyltransferase